MVVGLGVCGGEVVEEGVEDVFRVGFSGRFLRLNGADMRRLWRGKSLPQRAQRGAKFFGAE
jgi:hypothetical protein